MADRLSLNMAVLFQNNMDQNQVSEKLMQKANASYFSSRKFSLDNLLLKSSKDFIK